MRWSVTPLLLQAKFFVYDAPKKWYNKRKTAYYFCTVTHGSNTFISIQLLWFVCKKIIDVYEGFFHIKIWKLMNHNDLLFMIDHNIECVKSWAGLVVSTSSHSFYEFLPFYYLNEGPIDSKVGSLVVKYFKQIICSDLNWLKTLLSCDSLYKMSHNLYHSE